MGDFRIDPKLYDILNDEQKDLLKETLTQHKIVIEKDLQKDFSTKTETLKNEWLKEQEANNNALKEKESFLSSIPNENNKKLVNDLIELGKTQDDIKSNYSYLLEQEKQKPFNIDSLLTPKNDALQTEAMLTDIEYAKQVREKALDPFSLTSEQLQRFLKGSKDILK